MCGEGGRKARSGRNGANGGADDPQVRAANHRKVVKGREAKVASRQANIQVCVAARKYMHRSALYVADLSRCTGEEWSPRDCGWRPLCCGCVAGYNAFSVCSVFGVRWQLVTGLSICCYDACTTGRRVILRNCHLVKFGMPPKPSSSILKSVLVSAKYCETSP